MKIHPQFTTAAIRRRQRGVALFVAMIAMVLLSLAGIALVRSVETTNSVATNIAFRQGAIGPTSQAIEDAIDRLFKTKSITDQTVDAPGLGYFALLQTGESANGVPAVLAGDYKAMLIKYNAAGLPAVVADGVTGMEVRSIIERVCSSANAGPWVAGIGTCDMLPPKQSPGGTDNKYGTTNKIPLPPIPNFRVTVRTDLPNSNVVSHAQAIVR